MEEIGRSHWLFLRPLVFFLLCLCVPVLPIQNAPCTTTETKTVCEGDLRTLPKEIPSSVTDLDVSNINITSVEQNTLISFLHIKKLNMSRNKISSVHSKAFYRLIGLELLDLSFNHLTEISDNLIFNNIELKWFSIANNQHLKYIPQLLSKSLQTFNVSSCGIQHINETTFLEAESIKVLDISFNKITEIKFNTFDPLAMLYELYVNNNKLQNAQFITSDCSLSLTYLDISSNNISTLDLTTFHTLLTLRKIYLYNNPWRCDDNMKFVYENVSRNEVTLNLQCISALDNKTISWHEWYHSLNHVSTCPINSTSVSPTCSTDRNNTFTKISSGCDTSCVGLYVLSVSISVFNVVFIVFILKRNNCRCYRK